MIKMMILAPRRPNLSHAEFRDYVLNVHGPLVKSVPEVAAGIRRYLYNFPIAGVSDNVFHHPVADQFDIFTQAWFDSLQAQLDNMKHARYLSIVRPDEEVFADNSKALFHYTREHEIISGSGGDKKLFYVRRRKAGLTREEFQAQWRERYPAAIAGSALATKVGRYVQNHALTEAEHLDGTNTKFYDVIDEFALGSVEDWTGLAPDPALIERVRAVEDALLDTDRTRAFFAETKINIDGPVS